MICVPQNREDRETRRNGCRKESVSPDSANHKAAERTHLRLRRRRIHPVGQARADLAFRPARSKTRFRL